MNSQRKRGASPGLVTNPFIKKRNLEWRISPPPLSDPERRRAHAREGEARSDRRGGGPGEGAGRDESVDVHDTRKSPDADASTSSGRLPPVSPPPIAPFRGPSTSALIESAQLHIDDHLTYFATLLTTRTLTPWPPTTPRLPIATYTALYARAHARPTGAHFVVTQHDHPVAGPHYDLRLQINEASSCSWAIMYGLPGDPNSRGKTGRGRAGSGILRNATETRVHCLWNHLVETGARETGSLLVWDTGTYDVLPPRTRTRRRRQHQRPAPSASVAASQSDSDSDSDDGGGDGGGSWAELTPQQKLTRAFASRKICLRLHGTRLPRTYVVYLRLTREEDAAGRAKAAAVSAGKKRRRRRRAQPAPAPKPTGPDTSDSNNDDEEAKEEDDERYNDGAAGQSAVGLSEMDKELRELEDEEVRRTNAYVGAVNTIGSVHQRKWFLSLDREACGFVRGKREGRVWWERKDEEEEAGQVDGNRLKWPFYVRGPDYERSVVTGRLGRDVLKDEGVVDYVGRKGWRPILG